MVDLLLFKRRNFKIWFTPIFFSTGVGGGESLSVKFKSKSEEMFLVFESGDFTDRISLFFGDVNFEIVEIWGLWVFLPGADLLITLGITTVILDFAATAAGVLVCMKLSSVLLGVVSILP